MERLRFSTDVKPHDEAFAAYHDLYKPVADVARLGQRFSIDVRAFRLGHMILFDRQMVGVRHSRCQTRVVRNGFDHFTVQLALAGTFQVRTDSGAAVVPEGGLALIDMDRAMQTDVLRANVATLSVPRPVMERAAPRPDDLHGLVLPPEDVALLRDFVVSYLRGGTPTGAATASAIGRILDELLGLTLGGIQPAPESLGHAVDAGTRQRARRYIDANLTADPDAVARGVGRSRTVLYRAFAPHGGVGHYIQSRRLARLRTLLTDPRDPRTLAQLRHLSGFASDSHCTRSFKAAYGMTPGEFRTLRRRDTAQAAHTTSALLERWWSDLR